jgi:hypothetical protein
MALSVLLVTPSNLFSVRHGIVCSSCYPFKLILCSPWHCMFFLLPLQTYSLFSMALPVLLVTPSNLISVLHGIVCSSCYPLKLILCSPWHCLFFLLPLPIYSLFAMALSVLLVTPSNLFSVRHCIVCSSCYPFKLILFSPWHCLFFLLSLQTYSLFAMALSVLLVTLSNLFSVRLGIVCSSCYPFKRFLSVAMALSVLLVTPSNVSDLSPWHCLFFLLPLQTFLICQQISKWYTSGTWLSWTWKIDSCITRSNNLVQSSQIVLD